MITHVVLLNWKDGTEAAAIAAVDAGFAELAEQIPQIKSCRYGSDLGLFKGNADYALVAEFENEDDLMHYVHHPLHKAFLADVTGPLLQSFQSLQLPSS
jgi:hypothetical protein